MQSICAHCYQRLERARQHVRAILCEHCETRWARRHAPAVPDAVQKRYAALRLSSRPGSFDPTTPV